MEYGIQRRGIYLAPPDEAEVEWFCRQFESHEVWDFFGFDGAAKMGMLRMFRGGDLVVGILHRVTPRKRIGFVVMFPPNENRDFWEFGYAITDLTDRDAFAALYSTDAMAHYMFEHLNVLAMGWRTRSDNLAATAVIRRLGYKPFKTIPDPSGKYTYTLYRLDREGWMQRRAKLDRGEQTHPSGLGDTFITLPSFPYEPIPMPEAAKAESEPARAVEPAAAVKAEPIKKAKPAPKAKTKAKPATKAKKTTSKPTKATRPKPKKR